MHGHQTLLSTPTGAQVPHTPLVRAPLNEQHHLVCNAAVWICTEADPSKRQALTDKPTDRQTAPLSHSVLRTIKHPQDKTLGSPSTRKRPFQSLSCVECWAHSINHQPLRTHHTCPTNSTHPGPAANNAAQGAACLPARQHSVHSSCCRFSAQSGVRRGANQSALHTQEVRVVLLVMWKIQLLKAPR